VRKRQVGDADRSRDVPHDQAPRAPGICFALLPSLSSCRLVSTIRPDLPPPIPPCRRTKLDSRPAQYNFDLWMDKGRLYSAPSTSMMPFDVTRPSSAHSRRVTSRHLQGTRWIPSSQGCKRRRPPFRFLASPCSSTGRRESSAFIEGCGSPS